MDVGHHRVMMRNPPSYLKYGGFAVRHMLQALTIVGKDLMAVGVSRLESMCFK